MSIQQTSKNQKVFFALLVCIVTLSLFNTANTVALAGEEKEEPKGEGKGGEKKESPEWMEVETKLNAISSKLQAKKESIQKMIEEKKELPPNSPKVKELIDEMLAAHKEMETLSESYNRQVTIFKYRFPERGAKEHRKYEASEVKPLDQMEQELNIHGRLNRNMGKIRSQYGGTAGTAPAVPSDASATSGSPTQKDEGRPETPLKNEQKSLDDANSIIMKK